VTSSTVEAHIACLRSNWPHALDRHSLGAPKLINVPDHMASQLLSLIHGYPLCELVEPELDGEGSVFLKVAGFSFREAPIFHHSAGKIDSVNTLRLFVREIPARIRWGIHVLLDRKIPAQIELHPWLEIEPALEFRCFIRDGELVGISQYDADSYFDEVASQASVLEEALGSFVASFIHDLHIKTCAADVCFLRTPAGMSARLVELNPFVKTTDKCLFSSLPDSYFDGRFLYRHFAPD